MFFFFNRYGINRINHAIFKCSKTFFKTLGARFFFFFRIITLFFFSDLFGCLLYLLRSNLNKLLIYLDRKMIQLLETHLVLLSIGHRTLMWNKISNDEHCSLIHTYDNVESRAMHAKKEENRKCSIDGTFGLNSSLN